MDFVLGALISAFTVAFSVWFLFCRRKRKKLPVLVDGFAKPEFDKVAQVFRKSFETGVETGAAFAVYYKGELVVDLWGGYANTQGRIPWRENNMTIAFSISKGINALLVAKFVELGYLDYKKLVSHYWPEFAQNGKEDITVEMLLSHQSGLISFDKPLSLRLLKSDYKTYLSHLETQKPFWEPGSQFGYHIFTWGMFVDALIMKADPKKRTLDQIFREEITEPFGGIDFYQGVPTCEQYRIVPRLYSQPLWHQCHLFADKEFRRRLAHTITDVKGYFKTAQTPFSDMTVKNQSHVYTDYEFRQIPCTSFNGYGTARGVAKLYGIIANGGVYEKKRLFTESIMKTFEETLVQGRDVVVNALMHIGRGLMIYDSPLGSKIFGHLGFGGQFGGGDLQNKIGIAYLTNNLAVLPFIDPRHVALRDTVYECLNKLKKIENDVQ